MDKTPTRQEFQEWLANPVTQAFRALLRDRVQLLQEEWASGKFTSSDAVTTMMQNAEAIGQCHALEDMLEIDYIEQEISDGE